MIIAVAGLLVGFGAVPAANAATLGCGSACDYRNPETYNVCGNNCPDGGLPIHCANDKRTVSEYSLQAAAVTIKLRNSPYCRTVWALEDGCMPGQCTDVTITSFYSNGTVRARAGWYADLPYTPMLNDKGMLGQACMTVWDVNDGMQQSNPRHICTGKY